MAFYRFVAKVGSVHHDRIDGRVVESRAVEFTLQFFKTCNAIRNFSPWRSGAGHCFFLSVSAHSAYHPGKRERRSGPGERTETIHEAVRITVALFYLPPSECHAGITRSSSSARSQKLGV